MTVWPGGGCALERAQFVSIEFAPLPECEPLEFDRTHGDALEFLDRISDCGEQSTDLAIATFAEGEFEGGAVALAGDHAHADAGGATGADGSAGLAIGQEDAFGEGFDGIVFDEAFDGGEIGLGHTETGVSQAVCQFAVICNDEQSGGLEVESADGEESGLGWVVDVVHDGAAIGTGFIGERGEHACGLVEHEVEEAFGGFAHGAAIDHDAIDAGGDEAGQGGDDLAIDFDGTGFDESFAFASGCDAGVGHDALQAFGFGSWWRGCWAGHGRSLSRAKRRARAGR